MKCKVNGFWNNNGTGSDEKGRSFSWNNFFFSVTYDDKSQTNMIGRKSNTIKVKAAELNALMGLGLTPDGIVNFTAKDLQSYNVLGALILVDYDDDKNIIDFEILQEGKPSSDK